MKTLETERLILRSWEESDAEDLYEYAKNDLVGPNAGWKPHESISESKEIIKMFKESNKDYAIQLKENEKVIGGTGLYPTSLAKDDPKQGEVGYVLNPDYWGQGIIPEAVNELIRYGFEDLNIDVVWCAHFDFNYKSKRVCEKCSFIYDHTKDEVLERLDNKAVKTLFYKIERSDYKKTIPKID